MIPFIGKLKGTEKVAIQVLHIVMAYEYEENTCTEKRIYLSIYMYV